MCDKYKYSTKKDANTFINTYKGRLNKRGYLRAYYCEDCEVWHITSKEVHNIGGKRNARLKYPNEFKKYLQ